MTQSIDLTTVFLRLMDEAYKEESKTAMLDALTQSPAEFNGTAIVKVMKLSMVGLANYSRTTGYPSGDITAAWETLTLAKERGRQFTLDRMDNEESLGLVLGNVIREWMRMHVAPELDAYRFATYASWSGISTVAAATLSASTVLAAFDAAMLQMDEDEVPAEGRKLFVSSTVNSYFKSAVTRMLASEKAADRRLQSLDGVDIIPVPQTRFYTKVTLDAGASSTAGGYSKNTGGGGVDMNFLLLHPSAVIQAVKLNQVKYFDPDTWQGGDFHAWQYRLYHDAFVEDNKVKGVYLHKKAS